MVVAQVSTLQSLPGGHGLLPPSHRMRGATIQDFAQRDRAVMTTQAQDGRPGRLPRLRHRRATRIRYVSSRGPASRPKGPVRRG